MLNEEKIIGYFTKNYKKIGDDCAYLSQTNQLISTDTLVENTHFDLKYFTPKNIAHRLFTSNYSDIQSSGGKPKFALLNVSFPNKNFNLVNQIIKNFHKYCLKFGVEIVGGDTTSSDKIILSMTIISDVIGRDKIINRSNARINDKIYTFSGIGYSKLGYLNIYNKLKLPRNISSNSKKQFLNPKIYTYFDLFNKFKLTSCMDISDSLLSSLRSISSQSNKKIVLTDLSNINEKLNVFFKNDKIYNSLILSSGEEFVPVFTSPLNLLKLNNKKSFKTRGIKLTYIGRIEKGKGVHLKNSNLNKIKLFDHFKSNYSVL